MLGGVRALVRRLNAAGAGAIGFIYYSGHGAAEKDTNINYLIPVDAQLNRELAPGVSLSGAVHDVRSDRLYSTQTAFVLRVVFDGDARVLVH